MTLKLNQALASRKMHQVAAHTTITDIHHRLQKPGLLSGQSRVYTPREDEDINRLPAEYNKIVLDAKEMLDSVQTDLTTYFNSNATVEYGNCSAKADIKLPDGTVLLAQVPATYLLFLEKQLVDLHTLISKLPTLDVSEDWLYNKERGCYTTPPVQTVKTKKVPRKLEKAVATQYHPAQVDVYYEDVPTGVWETIKFSSAFPVDRVRELLHRVVQLQEAVKLAREEANTTVVSPQHVGEPLLTWLFA